ncbi:MAG TPA: hypothetical protein VG826_32240 [Pirellulales bacterium]|nr:hypothetical protein [Pirellulales bacterium]
MKLQKLFLVSLVAAIAAVSTSSKAHAAALLQSLVSPGINTLKDQDYEVYVPAAGNHTGNFQAGDQIITFCLYTTLSNANGVFGIGTTNYGSPTGGSTVFGNFYQLTSLTVTTITSVTDVVGTAPNQVADIAATSVTSDYENAAYTPTNNAHPNGTEFNPNRLTGETAAQMIARLTSETTSGNLILTATANQFLSEDANLTLASIPATGFGEATNFGFKVTSDPGGIGYVANGVTTSAVDSDEAGGPITIGPTKTDFAGTTLSLLNTSGNNIAYPIVTATTLQWQGTPEPGSMLIWAGLALAGGVYQRRRRGVSSRTAS